MQIYFVTKAHYDKLKIWSTWLLVFLWSVFSGAYFLINAAEQGGWRALMHGSFYTMGICLATLFFVGIVNMGYVVLDEVGGHFQDFWRTVSFDWTNVTVIEVKDKLRFLGRYRIPVQVLVLTMNDSKVISFPISQLTQKDLFLSTVYEILATPLIKQQILIDAQTGNANQIYKKHSYWKNLIIFLIVGILVFFGLNWSSRQVELKSMNNKLQY